MFKNIARRYADGNLIVQILVGIILGALVGFYTHYQATPYNQISAKIQTIQKESGLSVDEVIKTKQNNLMRPKKRLVRLILSLLQPQF